MSANNKAVNEEFELYLKNDGIGIFFDDGLSCQFSWDEIIKSEKQFYCCAERFPNKFLSSDFNELNKIADGLIDAGHKIKQMLDKSEIVN